MSLVALLSELKARGVTIASDAGQLRVSAPKGAMTPELQSQLRERKDELLALLQSAASAAAPLEAIQAHDPREPAPLSTAQHRLWFTEQLRPGTAALNLPFPFRVRGPLDVVALEWVVAEVGRRHDVLTSHIVVQNHVPLQVVSDTPLTLSIVDVSHLAPAAREVHVHDALTVEAAKPFDLSTAPLARFTLYRLSSTEHVLMFVSSHVVFDGWSHDVLFRELRELYEARVRGTPVSEPPVARFADFVRWHEAWLEEPAQARQLDAWVDKLKGMPTVLELPADRPRPAEISGRAVSKLWRLDEDLVRRLRRVALANGATLNMLALASLELLLSRYTGQTDFGIGLPSRGRVRPEAEELIGMFVNSLVVRSDVSRSTTFRQLLQHVRDSSIEAISHQDVRFDRLVQALVPVRESNRTPLLQALYSYQESSRREYRIADLELEQIPLFSGSTGTDATFWMRDHGDWAVGVVELSADLFTDDTASRWLRSWQSILEAVADNPDLSLDDVPVIAAVDLDAMLAHRATNTVEFPDATIHGTVERWAREFPDRTALCFEDTTLTYGELDKRANQIAHLLRQRGVGRDTLVGVCLSRGIDLVVAMLGVLKAGAGYLPLDASYPKERLELFVADSRATVVISSLAISARLHLGESQLLMDRDAALIAAQPTTHPEGREDSNRQLAYVIYTSGSTGRPKAVMAEHRNALHLFASLRKEIGFGEGTWLAGSSVSFDISVLEIWGSLCSGQTLVLLGDALLGDARATEYSMAAQAKRYGVTHYECTCSQGRLLLLKPDTREMVAGLKQLIVGGEALSHELSDELCRTMKHGELLNGYGPTEVTVYSSMGHMRENVPVTIGNTLPGVAGYVVDAAGRLAPWGAVGELWLGGPNVTRGYLDRPELTAERFVPNTFDPRDPNRLYRSGDLVRLDGALRYEYVGRNDTQIKIRGYRLELGEIESSIQTVPGIDGVVVSAYGAGDAKRLVGYVIVNSAFEGEAGLAAHLRRSLPEFMVPSAFVRMEKFPLTPSGKLDRNALPDPGIAAERNEYVSPTDAVETQLAAIWSRVLSVPQVGITDDFFALGGHSLLAVRIFDDINSEFGVRLPLTSLFDGPTVRQLSTRIREQQTAGVSTPAATAWTTIVPIHAAGSLPPFFCAAGIGGSPMNLVHLAAELGADQPFYGLQHRGIDGTLDPHRTIRAMAEEFVADVQKIQPKGPYYLGGFSMGGVVTYEMAQVLQERGEEIGLVVFLDTQAPTLPNWTIRERIVQHIARFREEGTAYLGRRTRDHVRRRIAHARTWFNLTLSSKDAFTIRHERVQAAGHEALDNYVPAPADFDVLLLRAQLRLAQSDGIGYRTHESNGWREFVRGTFTIEQIDMQHLEIVTARAAPSTAQPMLRGLRAAYAKQVARDRVPEPALAPVATV